MQPWKFQKIFREIKNKNLKTVRTVKLARLILTGSNECKIECEVRHEEIYGVNFQVICGANHILTWEFDPGSGWTLAACLTHASRTELFRWSFRMDFKQFSGGRVSNAWVTCLTLGDNSQKWLLIPHKRTASHDAVWKTPVVWDGPASD